ncbi:hypothetical protein I302_108429 [Kwoniella bestiolae CBS 10118]|uniref:RRM domain-containing protein n=1 Tax=Kwoniella bestiolae CBS 10118 TaxID=1296100 RepID=A0A1B9FVQ1_9TREE|nr:hypothetical protein I302_07197 [Kwoniella bestiolae CBS 10118]OCF22852.1 hypothetical protein I302_07197 [Kwoniella bestiolae CBS 10118]
MDLDKSLDDLVAEKRKTAPQQQRKAPRTSSGTERRSNNTPYSRPPPRSTDEKWVHDAYQGPKSSDRRGDRGDRRDTTALTGTGAGFTGISTRIEVVGLHYEVTPADLKGIFSQAGTLVQGPTIRYDRSGRSKGEATMEFASPQQAKIAINKFDGAMTKGQTISIRLLAPIVSRPRPGPPGQGPAQAQANPSGQSLLSRIQGPPGNGPVGGRGGRGGRGGPVRGRGAGAGGNRGGKRAGGGPKSEGDLDKELDSFMNNSTNGGGDVEMA